MAGVLVLASASPARLLTLRHAGIEPRVLVSAVDETAILTAAGDLPAPELVTRLAQAKACDVAARLTATAEASDPVGDGVVVVGCDSMLEFDGQVVGKPGDADTARARWRAMRGKHGVLHTGHWLIAAPGTSQQREAHGASSTVVHFADLSDAEIDAYVATGEPLQVAGGFTIDGLGGPFIAGVEGDHHGVVGISLPLLRELLARVGISITQLWSTERGG